MNGRGLPHVVKGICGWVKADPERGLMPLKIPGKADKASISPRKTTHHEAKKNTHNKTTTTTKTPQTLLSLEQRESG